MRYNNKKHPTQLTYGTIKYIKAPPPLKIKNVIEKHFNNLKS